MANVIVYVTIDAPADSVWTPSRMRARALVSRVAQRVRSSLGAVGDETPSGDAYVRWQGVGGTLNVTAHRNGSLTWTEPDPDPLLGSGLRLLAASVRAERDAGDVLPWPTDVVEDSITIVMRLHTPTFDRNGAIIGTPPPWFEPLFRIRHPWVEPVTLHRLDGPRYPTAAKSARVTARLEFATVVDTTGRVDPASIREMLVEPRRGGEIRTEYQKDFAAAIREYLNRVRFEPARVGGCPIRQVLKQVFEFRLD